VIHEDEVQAMDEKVAQRRSFLKSAGFTGLGLAAATLGAGKLGALDNTSVGKALGMKTTNVEAAANIDGAILNFALNLEYLEAEFYCMAAFGKRLAAFGGNFAESGATTGGKKVNLTVPGNAPFTNQLVQIAEGLAYQEIAHTKLIRGALGSSAVPKPAINLDALGVGFASLNEFIAVSRALEDTGLSAYNGAAPLITDKAYLATAAQIALTEANHSGTIRYLCAPLLVNCSKVDDVDILPPPAGTSYWNTTAPYALATSRTTDQVLAIVYGNSAKGTSKGGFYPQGMNGAINTIMS
jgi:hypothetical protein